MEEVVEDGGMQKYREGAVEIVSKDLFVLGVTILVV